jgi:hypothetical protein
MLGADPICQLVLHCGVTVAYALIIPTLNEPLKRIVSVSGCLLSHFANSTWQAKKRAETTSGARAEQSTTLVGSTLMAAFFCLLILPACTPINRSEDSATPQAVVHRKLREQGIADARIIAEIPFDDQRIVFFEHDPLPGQGDQTILNYILTTPLPSGWSMVGTGATAVDEQETALQYTQGAVTTKKFERHYMIYGKADPEVWRLEVLWCDGTISQSLLERRLFYVIAPAQEVPMQRISTFNERNELIEVLDLQC